MQLVSAVHGIGCCQQRKGGIGGENRASTARGRLIRKAARDVGLPDKLWDVPLHLINANEAGGPRETSWAPRWVCTQVTGWQSWLLAPRCPQHPRTIDAAPWSPPKLGQRWELPHAKPAVLVNKSTTKLNVVWTDLYKGTHKPPLTSLPSSQTPICRGHAALGPLPWSPQALNASKMPNHYFLPKY